MLKQPSFDEFCRWFPTLAEHFDCVPIASGDLVKFLRGPAATSGSAAAAKFCLAIWNYRRYKFNIADVGSWDSEHRAAFARWAQDPFWY